MRLYSIIIVFLLTMGIMLTKGTLSMIKSSENYDTSEDHIELQNSDSITELWYFDAIDTWNPSSPAIGDVDNDGMLEILIGGRESGAASMLYYLNAEDGTQLWNYSSSWTVRETTTLGDVDNDGFLEVVFSHGNLTILNGKNGTLSWTTSLVGNAINTPTIGDLNNDGKLDILVGDTED